MKMETKRDIFARYKKEYFQARKRKGRRKELTTIIDTVHDLTQLSRKSIIRAFKRLQMKDPAHTEGRGRRVYYTADTTAALKDIWETGSEVCGELLHPVLAEYVAILQRDGQWKHGDVATGKLLSMSMGTMKDRIGGFMKLRHKGRGISATSPSQLKHIIPIFHGEWSQKPPGSGQLDTVVHCGHTLKGDLVFTLNYTDIPTLWTLLRAQWNKGQVATKDSLVAIKADLPWPLLEVHPDTGSEFINWHMKGYCDTNDIIMTRSRPNHSNDNMHVEERNGHIVRKWIGYQRLDCIEAVTALNAVYDVLCPYLNHFVASRRVLRKYEIEGKWKKQYEPVAKTPYQRVLENEQISEAVKEKLRAEHATLNPLTMVKEIERLKQILYDTQRKYGTTGF